MNTVVTPTRVLLGKSKDQAAGVAVSGRPARSMVCDFCFQRRRTMSRCQRSTVSGVTIRRRGRVAVNEG